MGIDRIGQALDEIRLVVAEAMQDPAADAEALLELVRAVDLVERTGHGLMLRVLARVDQVKAAPAGVGPWLTSELGYQPGRGRAVAQDARRIGNLPVLAEKLASGHLNAGQTRMLARAEHAVKGTDQDATHAVTQTLTILETTGIQQAGDHVRALEHTMDPGRADTLQTRQRARSFARISELPEGMCRFDLLLDAERATLVRTALDTQVSAFLRTRQFDHTDHVPDDVHTTEHLTAEAFTRLAETFLNTTEDKRDERYCPTVVYYAPATQEPKQNPASTTDPTPRLLPPGCAQTAYGALIPLPNPTTRQKPAALHLTLNPNGQPTTLNGHPIDPPDPTTRLATPAQRLALAYRDHHCTHPGCTRPTTWSLHAHHLIPHSQHGPTTITNMTLLCPEHHTLTHHTH
jgi:HNH endonuclease